MDPQKVYFIFLKDVDGTNLCWRVPTKQENEQKLYDCFSRATKENSKRWNWFEVVPEDKLSQEQCCFILFSQNKLLNTFPSKDILSYYGLVYPKYDM
uniref:Uncharacterized protein n=1 Tax=Marseillevirus sp. TaxID=2809551 RepID=A0AA96ET34_9VIRU|nr:hypothetical protein MarDSR_337 [Marseillevirus sp.]